MDTGIEMVDMEKGELKFRVYKEEVTFNVQRTMKQPIDMRMASVIDCVDNPKRYSFMYLGEL